MAEVLEDSETTAGGRAGCSGQVMAVVPTIDWHGYDVGPCCPRDDLQRRLDDARVRLRLNPPKLGAPLRWSI